MNNNDNVCDININDSNNINDNINEILMCINDINIINNININVMKY